MVTLDPTIGREQRGMRPVLVVSPDNFNAATRLPYVAPITSGGNFARNFGFAVSLDGAGIKTKGVILCHQIRALDLSGRGGRFIEMAPGWIIDEALSKISSLFD